MLPIVRHGWLRLSAGIRLCGDGLVPLPRNQAAVGISRLASHMASLFLERSRKFGNSREQASENGQARSAAPITEGSDDLPGVDTALEISRCSSAETTQVPRRT